MRRTLLLRAGLAVALGHVVGRALPASAASDRANAPASPSAPAGRDASSGGSPAAGSDRPSPASARTVFAQPDPAYRLRFPRDFGAHPDFRTEWWYVTGWLDLPGGRQAGFQLTFFRSRTPHPAENPSRFAPTQLFFAHAALALPERGRLLHAQRAARGGFGLAEASEVTTDVRMGLWWLHRLADAPHGRYRAEVEDTELSLAVDFRPGAPPLLQGEAGFSRKGPRPDQSSHYYSEPHMAVTGRVRAGKDAQAVPVTGSAWLDHEWSTTLLDADAAGWDWIGVNLHDGASLMAFRIRDGAGATRYAHAAWHDAAQRPVSRATPVWEVLRTWRSPRSNAVYPVEMGLTMGGARLRLVPLMDDQEVDARASTGGFYWEGAVRLLHDGREIGRGYLELTGYTERLRL